MVETVYERVGHRRLYAALCSNRGQYMVHESRPAAELSIIESVSYLFVPCLSWCFFRERITGRKALAIGIIILGVVVFFL